MKKKPQGIIRSGVIMSKQENKFINFPETTDEATKKNSVQIISLPEKLLKSKPDSLLKVGIASRIHGIKGEIFIRPFNEEFQWPKNLKQIFLNGRPFSVKFFLIHKNGLRFLLQGISTRDEAKTLVGSRVAISKSLFTKKEDEFYLFELLNFEVHVSGKNKIGQIKQFSSNGGHDILLVKTPDKREIPIPFVESYIEAIHFEEKALFLNLPEGFPGVS